MTFISNHLSFSLQLINKAIHYMTIANFIAKTGATVAGAGLVAMSLVAAVPAAAQTTTTTTSSTDYAAQIAALTAQISSLQALLSATQGGSTTTSTTFTRDLTIGSHGTDVTALQTWLISKGFTISAGATGYFGAQTKAALAAWQAANGVSPAAGYFGAITRAKVASMSSTTTTTTTTTTTGTTGTLNGGEGSLDNFKIVGATNTSLNASDSDTVYGFEFKATGSDLMVSRVDYDVYNSNGTGATRPWSIFKTATLMHGNTTVASVDASNMSNWSEDGTGSNGNQIYRVRFDNLKDVVTLGSTADYYLQLSTQNAISNSNTGGTYTVFLASQGVRATDARGLQQYSTTGTTNATVSVSNSTTGSLVLSTGSDNPQTSTVQASTNAQTSGVVLTTFTLQAKDADVTVYTIPVTVATTSATATNSVRSFKLYQGSTLVDTESVGAGASNNFTFKNLNVKIPAGSTQSFSVKADINSVDGTTVPEGSSVKINVNTAGSFDAVNASGDQVTVTGSVTGNVITFKTIGVTFDATPSTSATVSAIGTSGTQQGTFTFTFNVTAFGQDIYFAKSNTAFTATLLDNTGTASSTANAASSTAISSTADTISGVYVVHSGQTKSVTITSTVNGAGGYLYAALNSFKYGTTIGAPTASSTTFTTNYQTNQIYIHQ